MSSQLVESFAADFTPEEYQDDYQAQLRQLIEAKIEAGDTFSTEETFGEQEEKGGEGAEVIDLMEALRRSVESSRGKRSGDAKGEKPAKEAAPSGTTRKKSERPTASRASDDQAASSKAPASTKEPAKKKTTRKKASA